MAADQAGKTSDTLEQSRHKAAKSAVSLLDIPPELRLTIYRIVFDSVPDAVEGATARDIEPSALLQTCSIVRHEAMSAFERWLDARIEAARERAEDFGSGSTRYSEAAFDAISTDQFQAKMEDWRAFRIRNLQLNEAVDVYFNLRMKALERMVKWRKLRARKVRRTKGPGG